jgi:hypothetical protein
VCGILKTALIIFAFALISSCAAGKFQYAPVYHWGTYLQKCEYQKYSVCCNYNSVQTGCSARLCTSMWITDGWEPVYEYCTGDPPDPLHRDKRFNESGTQEL